jgi:hypothetical protein
VGVAGGLLGAEQRLGEALVGPLLVPGPLGHLRQRWPRPGPSAHEEVGELGGAGHAGASSE